MKPIFEFPNQIAPRYIEPLFLPIEYGRWYTSTELKKMLRNSLGIDGSEIVIKNINTWTLTGLGETFISKEGRSKILNFRISTVGKQIQETYSTNKELFFDIIHFIYYSTWYRSLDPYYGRFWLYASVSDDLWINEPARMDSYALTAKLQNDCQQLFPNDHPTFSERSVRAVFPWLGALTPPFLEKIETKSKFYSKRRSFCTPQLFQLATDLVYLCKGLKYGTSIAVDNEIIELISKSCLLDPEQFWEMADRAKMAVRGFEIRKGQWGTSIALEGPPTWIELPVLKPISSSEFSEEGEEQ